jgi:hypothetical protein
MTRCIEACFTSVGTSTACADACLAERHVEALFACIRLNLDCAAICTATGGLMSRFRAGNRQVLEGQLAVCVAACRACAAECDNHARAHAHCRACAQACEDCANACTEMLGTLRAVV